MPRPPFPIYLVLSLLTLSTFINGAKNKKDNANVNPVANPGGTSAGGNNPDDKPPSAASKTASAEVMDIVKNGEQRPSQAWKILDENSRSFKDFEANGVLLRKYGEARKRVNNYLQANRDPLMQEFGKKALAILKNAYDRMQHSVRAQKLAESINEIADKNDGKESSGSGSNSVEEDSKATEIANAAERDAEAAEAIVNEIEADSTKKSKTGVDAKIGEAKTSIENAKNAAKEAKDLAGAGNEKEALEKANEAKDEADKATTAADEAKSLADAP